jgi:hypothetical protein
MAGVSNALAQAILSQKGPDIVGSFRAGQEEARQGDIRRLSGQALQEGGGDALKELQGIDPEVAMAIGQELGARSAKDINDFVRDAGIGLNLLQSGDTQGALSFAMQRRDTLAQQGRDTRQTDQLIQQIRSGDVDGAISGLTAFSESLSGARNINQKSFAPITLVDEETGEERLVTPTFDPRTGQAGLSQADIPEGFRIKSTRKTADEAGSVKLAEEQSKQSIKLSSEAFDKIPAISASILSIDDAIQSIDDGAETGVIRSKLPSFRKAALELDNIKSRMGLDVIGATTFGALSESELAFALDTALPDKLSPTDLRDWLVRKKDVQNRLLAGLSEAAIELGKGTTVAALLERRQAAAQQPPAQQTAQPAAQTEQRNITVDF